MGSPEEKLRHRRRLQNKRKKQKVRSPIAKALEEPQSSSASRQNGDHPRVIQDKRGKKHNLDDMTFRDLVEEIQED